VPLLDAGFENGLQGWNTAGVGDVVPTVVTDTARTGSHSARVLLTGTQMRSELILGGTGTSNNSKTKEFYEGDEAWYGFSFLIDRMVYGHPGAHNLIMQLKGDDDGSPAFGLQLWDYAGDDGKSGGRGLWSHGEGMGGDHFLAPVTEHQWHDVQIHFKVSNVGRGSYEVFFDGQKVASRTNTSTMVSAAGHVYIKDGIYRNPDTIPGTSEIHLDAARLGTTRASVLPG
jgi:hypothetical protein